MTISPRGVSTSVGVPGARITRTASGRETRTIGIPGTGFSSTSTISPFARRRPENASGRQLNTAAPVQPPKPGIFSPFREKSLYAVESSDKPGSPAEIDAHHPDAAPVALDAFSHLNGNKLARVIDLLRWEWDHADDLENHPFVRKYLQGSRVTVQVGDGVSATLPLGRDAVGLALAEVEQALGSLDAAIAVVEHLKPSHVAAVSLSELYIVARRYGDVFLLTYLGIAFRESGMHTASL